VHAARLSREVDAELIFDTLYVTPPRGEDTLVAGEIPGESAGIALSIKDMAQPNQNTEFLGNIMMTRERGHNIKRVAMHMQNKGFYLHRFKRVDPERDQTANARIF